MAESGAHGSLRKQGAAETRPDVSYRFVVSFSTHQAASVAWQTTTRKKRRGPVTSFLARYVAQPIGALLYALLCLKLATVVYHAVAAVQPAPIAGLMATVTFFGLTVGLALAGGLLVPRLQKKQLWRSYQEVYVDNEFLLEGRRSHLWFDDRCVGAVRHWSTVDRVVEFEDGIWLFLRKRGLSREAYLISKESLPGSCPWDELKAYLGDRIAEGASSRVD